MNGSNDRNYEIGDVVKLRSGGPSMTVTNFGSAYGPADDVVCVWFDGNDKKSSTFRPASLAKID